MDKMEFQNNFFFKLEKIPTSFESEMNLVLD